MKKIKFLNIFLDKIDSTQTWTKKNYKKFDIKNFYSITAKEQEKGRGRFKRKWHSPKGNLYSTFFFIEDYKKNFSTLAIILAFSLSKVLLKNYNLPSKIKWPNDLLINNKKIAGILSEIIFKYKKAFIFLGIGVNINIEKKELKKIDIEATSLEQEIKKTTNVKQFLKEFQKEFSKDLEIFLEKGFSYFYTKIQKLLYKPKKDIIFFDGEKRYKGKIISISKEGKIEIKLKNNTIKSFFSGDIIHS